MQGEWGGDDLRDAFRMLVGGLKHGPCFSFIHRHPGFAQHMFPRLQSHAGRLAMQVGPGADDHRVDVFGLDDVVPVIANRGDLEFVGDFLRRGRGAVGHFRDLASFDGLEFRNMHFAGIGTRSDDADPNCFSRHRSSLIEYSGVIKTERTRNRNLFLTLS